MLVNSAGKRVEYDIRTYRYHKKEHTDKAEKIKSALGAVGGTVMPMLLIAKKQKTNIFNIKYNVAEMVYVSAGSIIGGTAAGIISGKKEHKRQKVNEGVFQFMNASVPTVLTGALYLLSEKFKVLNNLTYKISATVIGLAGGMLLAAKLSNKINDPYDKVPDRKLTFKDSIANIDDALGVLVLAKVPFAEKLHIEKTLPAIYAWCGYRAGTSN